MRKKKSAGFTLIEMLLALTVLLAFLGIVSTSVVRMVQFTSFDLSLNATRSKATREASDLRDFMTFGLVQKIESGGDRIVFKLPLDADQDGVFVDRYGGLALGGLDKTVNGSLGVTFEKATDLDETQLGQDINGDGDRLDQLELGALHRIDTDGTSTRITGTYILQPAGAHGSELDAFTGPDPIFAYSTNHPGTVTLKLVCAWPSRTGWLRRVYESSIPMLNADL